MLKHAAEVDQNQLNNQEFKKKKHIAAQCLLPSHKLRLPHPQAHFPVFPEGVYGKSSAIFMLKK